MQDRARALCLALFALGVYLATLCPTVYEGDSGELLAAVTSLGVSHPTGFPLYIMLAKLATVLIPAGDAAFRVNVLSALFAAAAVAATFGGARILGLGRGASAGAALFLAFSSTLWSHATAARVYSMTAFFIVTLLAIMARWLRDRDAASLSLFGLVLGLALGTHVTAILAVPAMLAAILATDRAALRSSGFRLGAVTALVVGASLYLYLPIAAARSPAMNWSDPRTLPSIVYYLTQREYASIMGLQGAGAALSVMGQALRGAFSEFTWLGFALALLGIVPLWKRHRVFLGASALVIAANLLLLMNYGYAAIGEVFPIHRYFYPGYIVLAFWIGFGLEEAAARVRSHRFATRAAGLVFLLAAIPLVLHYRAADRSRNTIVRDYGANLLASVPEGGVLFTKGDAVSGSVWYLQIAEGERPDVAHIQRDLLAQDWYAREIARRFPALTPPDLLATPGADRWLHVAERNVATRPVFSTSHALDRFENVPHGLLVRFLPAGTPSDAGEVVAANEALWSTYRTEGVLDENIHKDVMVREMVRFYSKGHANLGVFEADAGFSDAARRAFETSLRYDPDNAAALYNLGGLVIVSGDTERGSAMQERAARIAAGETPEGIVAPATGVPPAGAASAASIEAEAAVRSGISLGQRGEHARAMAEFQRALTLDSLFAPAWLSLGTTYLIMQRPEDAIASYERAVSLDDGPLSSTAHLNLGMLYAQVRNDPARAMRHLERFLEINPDDSRREAILAEIARLSSLPRN